MPTVGGFGERVKRVEDPRFLMGQAKYVDDIKLPNTLDVAFVRSSYAHAKIKSIDISKALAHPGVHRIMTGEEAKILCKPMRVEIPAEKFPAKYKACDFPAIAVGKVKFVGDIVAAVVATNRYVAEDAAELVEVNYEPLTPVVDAEKAMLSDSPLIHEDWDDNLMLSAKIDSWRSRPSVQRSRRYRKRTVPDEPSVCRGDGKSGSDRTSRLYTQADDGMVVEPNAAPGSYENRRGDRLIPNIICAS